MRVHNQLYGASKRFIIAQNLISTNNRSLSTPDNYHRHLRHTNVEYLPVSQSYPINNFHTSTPAVLCLGADSSNVTQPEPLTEYQAYEMVHKLAESERICLRNALNQYESDLVKAKLEGELAATRWRTKFSRRQKMPVLGDVDPTGSYCAMPDDWLQKKLAESAHPPTAKDLRRIMLVNAVPFVGFGFLDNFVMIVAGDSIEYSLGLFMCVSTMAAAALGNTISDVLGLGLANYVERFCDFLGLTPPKLTPAQMEMKVSRKSAGYGRSIGITVGCLLGMIPLLFINSKPSDPEKEAMKK